MNKKLKVGLVFDDSLDQPDGVSAQVKTIGAWLSSQGHQVSYLVGETTMTSYAGGRVYSLAKNLKVSFNGNQMSIPLKSSAREVKEVIAKEKFDVLHVMAPYSPVMSAKAIRAVPTSTAVVASFHIFPANYMANLGGQLLGLMLWKSKRRIDSWLSVSAAAREFARKSFGVDSRLVPNMIDVAEFSSSNLHPKAGRIVYLGRLVERKGASQLIDAFNILNQERPGLSLVIGGKGPLLDKLQSKVRKLNLTDKVSFKGFVKAENKASFLASGEIICFPSLGGESFGVVLLEAMAAGRGVLVAGDNAGYRYVLQARPQQIVEACDPLALANTISLFLSDKAKARKAVLWQKAEVGKYDVNKVGPELIKEYERAIAKRSASGA